MSTRNFPQDRVTLDALARIVAAHLHAPDDEVSDASLPLTYTQAKGMRQRAVERYRHDVQFARRVRMLADELWHGLGRIGALGIPGEPNGGQGGKIWLTIDWAACPDCGCGVEVLTACREDDEAFDGDDARCVECCKRGSVSIVDSMYINWLETDKCDG